MSVINKVLRDLDQRQSGQRSGGVADGAAAVGQGAAVASGGWPVRWVVGVLFLLAMVALGAYLSWRGAPENVVTVPLAPASVAQKPIPAPAVVATTLPAMTPTQAANQTTKPVTAKATVSAQPLPATKPMPAVSTPVPAVAVPAPPAPRSEPVELALQSTATPAPRPLQQVAQEALAQAQVLWQQGNQPGAMELVRGVIARLEQSSAGDSTTLAAAAREYVRMAQAQGRAADALAMLVRLEPRLRDVADIWALRGHTAQRLGLHSQAVHAYMQALALRPGQARWLLGAAVSLAAQGQTVPAAELAQQAGRAGYLPSDVANYLQQLGVVLREP